MEKRVVGLTLGASDGDFMNRNSIKTLHDNIHRIPKDSRLWYSLILSDNRLCVRGQMPISFRHRCVWDFHRHLLLSTSQTPCGAIPAHLYDIVLSLNFSHTNIHINYMFLCGPMKRFVKHWWHHWWRDVLQEDWHKLPIPSIMWPKASLAAAVRW